MKVLKFNGSAHVHGCSARALDEVEKTLLENGIETERIEIGVPAIRGCIGCGTCRKNNRCVFDDIVNETAPKMAEADGIVVGTPVYYAHANGQVLAFLDRLFYSTATAFDATMKVGAAVISSRRAGSTCALDEINKYFTIRSMPVVSSTYWNEVHGGCADDVEKDLEGLQTMRNLARNMAFLIKAIDAQKKLTGVPAQELAYRTSFADGK